MIYTVIDPSANIYHLINLSLHKSAAAVSVPQQ